MTRRYTARRTHRSSESLEDRARRDASVLRTFYPLAPPAGLGFATRWPTYPDRPWYRPEVHDAG